MGNKKVFYLDPDKRRWTMKDLGLSWETDNPIGEKMVYYYIDGKMYNQIDLMDLCLKCLVCLSYNEEHDSLFCNKCDEWREPACADPTCEYCFGRPAKPSHYK